MTPGCSMTNSRWLPSRALVTKSGLSSPFSTGASRTAAPAGSDDASNVAELETSATASRNFFMQAIVPKGFRPCAVSPRRARRRRRCRQGGGPYPPAPGVSIDTRSPGRSG